MRMTRVPGLLCVFVLSVTGPAFGWSLLDEVTVLDPTLTASMVWEMPDAKPYCESGPENMDRLVCELGAAEDFLFGLDAAGNRYGVIKAIDPNGDFFDVYRRPAGTQISQKILRITARVEPVFGEVTKIQISGRWEVDLSNGDLLLSFRGQCLSSACAGQFDTAEHLGLVRISGLPALFEIASSYSPSGEISFRLPSVPEGLPNGSRLDIYAGDLSTLPDFSLAQAIECDVAAGQIPGSQILHLDTLPDPGIGAGRYYVTVVTDGTVRRGGRNSDGGILSGRDVSGLPLCPGT